jgi:uncharacterized protein (DUF2249 family)
MTFTLDVTPIPPAARHDQIRATLDQLCQGDSLELIVDHRPSPLRYELDATRPGQYRWEDDETGPDRWTARITCLARVVDARPMLAAGEEPFATIMAAVAKLGDEPLVVLAPFEPVPLEGVLGSHGFAYDTTELEGGTWRTVFRRAG